MLFQLVLSSLCFTLIVLFCYISARCTSSSYCDVVDGSLHYSLNVLLCIIPLYFVLPNLSKYIYTIIIITLTTVCKTRMYGHSRVKTQGNHTEAFLPSKQSCLQLLELRLIANAYNLLTMHAHAKLFLLKHHCFLLYCLSFRFFFLSLSHLSFLFLSTRQRRCVTTMMTMYTTTALHNTHKHMFTSQACRSNCL